MIKLLTLFFIFFHSNSSFGLITNEKIDSSHLTSKAWEYYDNRNFNKSLKVIDLCISLYLEEAIDQQMNLDSLPVGDNINDYLVLNDVGTCLHIKSEILKKDINMKKNELINTLNLLCNKLKYCQCWSDRGWYWQPALEAKSKLVKIELNLPLNN